MWFIICRCGSYDHHLYAINYKDHCCTYKISCGGSIYGSPAIDMVFFLTVWLFISSGYPQILCHLYCSLQTHNMIYVASTSGLVTAISLEVSFSVITIIKGKNTAFSFSLVFLSFFGFHGRCLCELGDTNENVISSLMFEVFTDLWFLFCGNRYRHLG